MNRTSPFAGLLLAALFTSSCQKPAPPTLPPPIVQVLEVVATNAPAAVEFIGQLDAPNSVEVRARIEAFVEAVLFNEGKQVKEGDPLFELDKRPFQQRLAAAQGRLGEAQASLNKAQKDVARLEPLAEKRAIPQQDLDNARASVDVAKANLASAEAGLQSTQIDLGYCDVLAPISGLIGAKAVSVGALVGKGEPTLLATISQLDPIWFYCAVSEVDYLKAERERTRRGRKVQELEVTLVLADGSEHPDKGRIVFIDRAVDASTGTMRVRAEFPNPNGTFRPGMFARIKVDLGQRPDSILVPERAVSELQGRNFVWVIGPDQRATQRGVTVGEELGGNLLILEGLKPGERIVVEGLQKVREGAPVQPMTAAEMASAGAARAAGSQPAQE